MIPSSFDESNYALGKPENMTHEECDPLSIRVARDIVPNVTTMTSCWKMTQEELDEINKTGRVWITICGCSHPPIMVNGIKPFNGEANAVIPPETG